MQRPTRTTCTEPVPRSLVRPGLHEHSEQEEKDYDDEDDAREDEPRQFHQRTTDADFRRTDPDIDKFELLIALCRHELGAVEAYAEARVLPALYDHTSVIVDCHASHRTRAGELARRIEQSGSRAPTMGGVWGALPLVFATPGAVLSEKYSISLLNEAEKSSSRWYGSVADALDRLSRDLFIERILPEQELTSSLMAALKSKLG